MARFVPKVSARLRAATAGVLVVAALILSADKL
jgi:hypothetical protein